MPVGYVLEYVCSGNSFHKSYGIFCIDTEHPEVVRHMDFGNRFIFCVNDIKTVGEAIGYYLKRYYKEKGNGIPLNAISFEKPSYFPDVAHLSHLPQGGMDEVVLRGLSRKEREQAIKSMMNVLKGK